MAKPADTLFNKPKAVQPAAEAISDYRALLAQRAELDEKIKAAREEEVAGVLEQIRQLVADYGLENEVTFAKPREDGRRGPRSPAAPKYRDPESGNTWSGRGKAPKWIAGKDRNQFLITE